jgi:hypothetical protein
MASRHDGKLGKKASMTGSAVAAILIVFVLIAPAIFGGWCYAQSTYSDLTSPNASAGPANVSKMPITSAVPATSQARIFAHLEVWFGNAAHKDVGYNSTDPVQIEKQVTDMMSRGISGVVINWGGPTNYTNQAVLGIMAEAENRGNSFQFLIEEDAAAFSQCASTVGCDLQGQAVNDLKYILATYAKSPTYVRYQGRAVIFLYGMETYTVNWTSVENALPERPILVMRPANGTSMTPLGVLRGPVLSEPVEADRWLSCRLTGPEMAIAEVDHA